MKLNGFDGRDYDVMAKSCNSFSEVFLHTINDSFSNVWSFARGLRTKNAEKKENSLLADS
jgi:hypothetical protein